MKIQLISCLLIILAFANSCKKNKTIVDSPDQPQDSTETSNHLFNYSDSVFYLKASSYTVTPTNSKQGTYTAFPGNLNIDKTTGAITITLKGSDGQSQTGLRYKINFKANTGETDSTYIIISGISYFDKFYYLSQNDSIISPVYNSDSSKNLPAGNYDLAHDNKFAINAANGQINAKELIRRGFFDNQLNASWKEVTVKYAANDGSNNASNSIDIILYYYNSINDVPSNVSKLMQAHQSQSLGVNRAAIPLTTAPIDNNLSSDLSLSKPRPPCIVIVGH